MSFAFISQPFGELSNTVLPAAASEAQGRNKWALLFLLYCCLWLHTRWHRCPQIITKAFCAVSFKGCEYAQVHIAEVIFQRITSRRGK